MGKALLVGAVVAATGCIDGDDLTLDDTMAGGFEPIKASRQCDLHAPFAKPVPVPGLMSAATELGAQLTADELTIFFASDRSKLSGLDLFVAKRAARSEPFKNIHRIDELATATDDRDPAPSASGTTLYFWRDGKVLSAATDRYSGEYGGVEPEAAMEGIDAAWAPFIGRTGLYFARPGTIDFAPRQTNGRYATPVMSLASDQIDGNPVVDGSELTMLFAGRDGEVWSAHRDDLAHRFELDGPVTELGSTGIDRPTWISRDGCTLYLESDRTGNFELYIATRSR